MLAAPRRRLALISGQLAASLAQPPTLLQRDCAASTAPATDDITALVESIHAFTKLSDARVAIMATGAGSDFIKTLLGVAGASSTVLEAVVPYAVEAQTNYLGYETHASVHGSTARDFAQTALERAASMCADSGEGERRPIGLAVTASLATNRERRGANRALIAAALPDSVRLYEVSLEKERRDREGEDRVVTWAMLQALCEALQAAAPPSLPTPAPRVSLPAGLLGGEGEGIAVSDATPPPDPVAALLAGQLDSVTIHPNGRVSADCPFKGAVLAGSFNPLHEGHEGLLRSAAAAVSLPMAFELAVTNADKGTLDAETVAARVAQFREGEGRTGHTLLLTTAPTFIDKTAALPGCAFVVGADTAERLVQDKYYGGTLSGLQSAFDDVAAAQASFIVAGRVDDDTGLFVNFDAEAECEAVGVDPALFRTLSEAEFRMDISSSELRAQGRGL